MMIDDSMTVAQHWCALSPEYVYVGTKALTSPLQRIGPLTYSAPPAPPSSGTHLRRKRIARFSVYTHLPQPPLAEPWERRTLPIPPHQYLSLPPTEAAQRSSNTLHLCNCFIDASSAKRQFLHHRGGRRCTNRLPDNYVSSAYNRLWFIFKQLLYLPLYDDTVVKGLGAMILTLRIGREIDDVDQRALCMHLETAV